MDERDVRRHNVVAAIIIIALMALLGLSSCRSKKIEERVKLEMAADSVVAVEERSAAAISEYVSGFEELSVDSLEIEVAIGDSVRKRVKVYGVGKKAVTHKKAETAVAAAVSSSVESHSKVKTDTQAKVKETPQGDGWLKYGAAAVFFLAIFLVLKRLRPN